MRLLLIICCFVLTSASTSHLGHTQGTLTIDVLTFEKILHRFDAVLIKFDDKFPFGGLQDDFKSISLSVARSKDFIIAEVPVTDRDEKENFFFALDYQAFKPDFPIYRLFLKGKPKPIHYTGDRSADDLRRFLLRHTNVWLGLNGTLEVLDGIARDFFDATFDKNDNDRDAILEKARNLVESMENQKEKANGEVYVKTMQAVVKNGIDYFNREVRRIQNLLKGKVSKEKKQELVERENILLSFKSLRETKNENEAPAEQKQESTNVRQEL